VPDGQTVAVEPIRPLINVQSSVLQPIQTLTHTITLTPEQTERMILDYMQMNFPNFPKNAKIQSVRQHGDTGGYYKAVQFVMQEHVKVGRIKETPTE
jgi:hypothetical protein